jgi:hypothetical protein
LSEKRQQQSTQKIRFDLFIMRLDNLTHIFQGRIVTPANPSVHLTTHQAEGRALVWLAPTMTERCVADFEEELNGSLSDLLSFLAAGH